MKTLAESPLIVRRVKPFTDSAAHALLNESARERIPNTLSSPLSKLREIYQKLDLQLGGVSLNESDLLLEMRKQATDLIRQIDHINELINLRSEMKNENEKRTLQESLCYAPDDIIHEEALDLGQVYQRLSDVSMNIHSAPVHINKKHLRKIMRELIENAFNASEAGDKLEVSSELTDTHSVIQIKDCGEGLPEYQTEALNQGRRISNSGLGLVIVNELLELYHGEIRFFSIPCRGTTVRFTIPRVKDDE